MLLLKRRLRKKQRKSERGFGEILGIYGIKKRNKLVFFVPSRLSGTIKKYQIINHTSKIVNYQWLTGLLNRNLQNIVGISL